jgi:hypothetical protein
MPTDAITTTFRRRLPVAAALLSCALLIPASLLALASPMAMDSEQSIVGWASVLFLLAQPVMLMAAAMAGALCYRRFTKWRFLIALAPPGLFLLSMRILSAT